MNRGLGEGPEGRESVAAAGGHEERNMEAWLRVSWGLRFLG